MANKFLGEAGLAVLVEEIKKKSTSEGKSMLDITLENCTLFDFDNETLSDANVVEYHRSLYSLQILNMILGEVLGSDISIPEFNSIREQLDWIIEQLNKPMDSQFTSVTYRTLLSDDAYFIGAIASTFTLVRVESGVLRYRNNPGDKDWFDYNPVNEISADEVTNKFA